MTDGNITDPCVNVSCPNMCDTTTLLNGGYCENGMCRYTKIMNSTEFGYAETDDNNIAILPSDNITTNRTINVTNNDTLDASFEVRIAELCLLRGDLGPRMMNGYA